MSSLRNLSILSVTWLIASAQAAEICQKAPGDVLYAATFKPASSSKKMRFVMGHQDQAKATGSLVAQIWADDTCEASCAYASTEAETPYSPQAIHFDCKSAHLGAFSAPATLIWPEKGAMRPQNAPMLRFGTWLNGYENAPLLVELDRYRAQSVQIARAQ